MKNSLIPCQPYTPSPEAHIWSRTCWHLLPPPPPPTQPLRPWYGPPSPFLRVAVAGGVTFLPPMGVGGGGLGGRRDMTCLPLRRVGVLQMEELCKPFASLCGMGMREKIYLIKQDCLQVCRYGEGSAFLCRLCNVSKVFRGS